MLASRRLKDVFAFARDRGVDVSHDLEYYRQRAVTERALAREASRADVAAIHEELATLYQALVDHGGTMPVMFVVPNRVAA